MYLIRHGATAANLANPYTLQGRKSDPPLHAIGVDQAKSTRVALQDVEVAATYSSPLQRAVQTACLIVPQLQPRLIPAITECDVGRWEGKTWDTIREQDPTEYSQHMTDSVKHGYPDGESFADVLTRSEGAFRELAKRHEDQTILVVSHHVVIRSYLASVLGLATSKYRQVSVANCGINVIEFENGHPRIVRMNDTQHLVSAAA